MATLERNVIERARSVEQAVIEAAELLEGLAALESVQDRLFRQPDPAAEYLAAVLAEIQKSYKMLEEELARIPMLSLQARSDVEARLREMRGHRVRVRLEVVRGKYIRARSDYHRYLQNWFAQALEPEQARVIEQWFEMLLDPGKNAVQAMERLMWELPVIADELTDLLSRDEVDEAAHLIEMIREQWLEPRRQLTHWLTQLERLAAGLARFAPVLG